MSLYHVTASADTAHEIRGTVVVSIRRIPPFYVEAVNPVDARLKAEAVLRSADVAQVIDRLAIIVREPDYEADR